MSDHATTLAAKAPDAAFRARAAFRLATTADAEALASIVNAAYERERWLLPAPRTDNEMLVGEIATPHSRLIVATIDGTLAGCVRVRLLGDGAWFGLLATAPAFQGRGLASMLVDEAERVAYDEGARAMRLECAEELGLCPYYASLGYAIESRGTARFSRNDVDITRVVMRKELAR